MQDQPSYLSLIARIPPEAWDAIVPKGPRAAVGVRLRDRLDLVALNPQPLPPVAAFLVGAADTAHVLAGLAVERGVEDGGRAGELVAEVVDDWCGTGWPRRFPFPWPGPDPDPRDGDLRLGRLVGAVVLASFAERMPGTELGAAFAAGAERLGEVALGRA